MGIILLLALSVLPVIALAIYIYKKDRFQQEPLQVLVLALVGGMLSVLPVVGVEYLLEYLNPFNDTPGAIYRAFIVAACTEEGFKLLVLYLLIWRNRHFDEYFDGIVYAVFVSLGFAGIENVLYVFSGGVGVGIVRALFSVPGHFLFAVLMGYFFALAKFGRNRSANMALAFVVPMVLHGIFDALLMVADVSEPLQIICLVGFIVFDVFLWKIGMKRMKQLEGN